ncbi:MAG: LpxD N-terminal domain-containing protein, partial [Gammaproteobacteria bacterium]
MRLDELATVIGAQLRGDGACEIVNVATLAGARAGEISFLSNRRYREQLGHTQASAVILEPRFADACPCNALLMANPY